MPRTAIGTGMVDLTSPITAPAPAELASVVKERRPAPSPLLHERLDSRRGAAVGVAGQQLGGEPSAPVLGLGRQYVGPVHAGGLELPGPHVMPQRRLTHPVQIFGKPLIDLPVVRDFL